MKIEVFSLHFVAYPANETEKRMCLAFAVRFAEYSFRVPGYKGIKRIVKLYAGSNSSRTEFRYHINAYEDFKLQLRHSGIPQDAIEEDVCEMYIPAHVEFDLNPKFQPREQQPQIIEFVHQPGVQKQIGLQTGKGKALSVYEPVLTPSGWVPIGQIRVGDDVCAPDGSITKVNGVYPQGKLPLYKVTFRDGRTVRACKDHLWKVYYVNTVPHRRWRVVNTVEMLRLINMPNPRVYVPLIEPWAGIDYELPLDPYLLGVLIGDGCFTQRHAIMLSSPDEHILDKVRDKLDLYDYELRHKENYDYGVLRKSSEASMSVHIAIEQLGLAGKSSLNKFIPQCYLDAKAEDRWALLQGLIDTDGTVGKEGHITYSTSSSTLAKNVQYLVRSLGGICKIRSKQPFYTHNGERKQGNDSYILSIRVTDPKRVCTLPKKRDRIPEEYQYNDLKLQVTSIELDGEDEAVCIAVDHPDKLFITRDFTVTHNTFTALFAAALLQTRMLIILKKGYIHRWFSDLLGPDSVLRLEPDELLIIRGATHLSEVIIQAMEAGGLPEHIKVVMVSSSIMDAYFDHYDEMDGDMSLYGGLHPTALCALWGIGTRILDEYHQLLHINFRFDLYMHLPKCIYLTATLIASSPIVDLVYRTVFPATVRAKVGEYDKYINMTCFMYGHQNDKLRWTQRGSTDYSQVAYEESIMKHERSLMTYLEWQRYAVQRYFLDLPDLDPRQKCLIFCGTIEYCTLLRDYLIETLPEDIKIGRFVSLDAYDVVLESQIIISTHGSLGTAHDIPDLRVAFKFIGMGKEDANVQNAGRLRKLARFPGVTPEYYYATCRDIPQHLRYHDTMKKLFIPRTLKFNVLETDVLL